MVKCHQYGISVLISQMSSCKETSGGVAEFCLFSQAAATAITGLYNCTHACRLNSSQFLRLPCG